MRNEVLELNSGSVDEIGIFRDQIEFFFKPIMQNQGLNWINWVSNGQLRVKSHKSEIKD